MSAQNQASPITASLRLPRWMRVVLIGRNPKVTLVRALFLAVLCVLGYKATLLHIRIEGISMMPTYQGGSRYFVNRLAYLWHPPQRGDVVGVRYSPVETNGLSEIHRILNWLRPPHIMLLKRIIGLPGETVAFVNGRVLIDGRVLDEPYEKYRCHWNLPPVKVGPNQYFVVGDNRSMPPEYHEFGKVERDRILGKLIR